MHLTKERENLYQGKQHHYKSQMCVWVFFFFLFIYLFIYFLGPHPWHMEVPRLGLEFKLQLLAYATATAMWDPSCICNPHHS